MKCDNFAIIVAGGRGTRMGGDTPKQFMLLGGRPVLMHTLEVFRRAIPDIGLVVVLPAAQLQTWDELCRAHAFTLQHTVVTGGETRFHSVSNGLRAITAEAGYVGVHDGVRPFVSVDVIRRCYEAARTQQAVVPVVPVVETLRELLPEPAEGLGRSVTRDRSRYCLVQTPQVFDIELLRLAYRQPYRDTFTDDASVVEAAGQNISLVEGNRENIKLTTPFDVIVAEALVSTL